MKISKDAKAEWKQITVIEYYSKELYEMMLPEEWENKLAGLPYKVIRSQVNPPIEFFKPSDTKDFFQS